MRFAPDGVERSGKRQDLTPVAHWAEFQPGFWEDEGTRADPFEGEARPEMDPVPQPGELAPDRATKPKGPDSAAKKHKRKQQKKARKANRKRK